MLYMIICLVKFSSLNYYIYNNHVFLFYLAKRGINSKDYFILTIQIPIIHRINSIISTNIVNMKCSLSYSTTSM